MIREGTRIKVALLKANKTQLWLIDKLGERGINTSKTEMSSVLNGNRRGNKADLILTESIRILQDNELARPNS